MIFLSHLCVTNLRQMSPIITKSHHTVNALYFSQRNLVRAPRDAQKRVKPSPLQFAVVLESAVRLKVAQDFPPYPVASQVFLNP